MSTEDTDMEIKLPYIVWSFFWNKYQIYIGLKTGDYELYKWQKRWYG